MAGRFGYCSLDRTRATLLGDEVRACWQAPVRSETFEGLFRELSGVTEPVGPAAPALSRQVDDRPPGTRTWAIPVTGASGGSTGGGPPGGTADSVSSTHASNGTSQRLVEAPFVPARGIRSAAAHLVADGRPLLELEVQRVPGGAAVGGDDPNAHQPIPGSGPGTAQPDP